MNSSGTKRLLCHYKTIISFYFQFNMKFYFHGSLCLWNLSDLFPYPNLLQRVSCVSLWHALLLWHKGISCYCLLVLSRPPTNPVHRNQEGNSGLVVEQSWRAVLLHTDSFDSTSVVILSLLTDMEMCQRAKQMCSWRYVRCRHTCVSRLRFNMTM